MTYKEALNENFRHFLALNEIMEKHGWPKGGGSYLIDGQSLAYNMSSFAKQELLYNTVNSLPENSKILEVGVYAAHSAFIMLVSNPSVRIIGIDTCYPFTEECMGYLNDNFGYRMALVKGSSKDILPDFTGEYDLYHVDGSHAVEMIKSDIEMGKRLLKKDGVIVMDDWDGVEFTMGDWVEERIEIMEVSKCPNPNAIGKYK